MTVLVGMVQERNMNISKQVAGVLEKWGYTSVTNDGYKEFEKSVNHEVDVRKEQYKVGQDLKKLGFEEKPDYFINETGIKIIPYSYRKTVAFLISIPELG